MENFQTLVAEHDHLDDLALRLVRIAERSEPDPLEALVARSDLSVSLDYHLGREDTFLYDELLSGRAAEFSEAVATFHSEFEDLTTDWNDYLRLWDQPSVQADWPQFCSETIAIMARLRARISEENALLYPLALRHSRIRLRTTT